MADLKTDFAQVNDDIAHTESLIAEAMNLTNTMKGDGGSFTNFQNDFNNLLNLLGQIDASLGSAGGTPVSPTDMMEDTETETEAPA